MKQLPTCLLLGLLLAAPASQLSARSAPVLTMAEETLTDATAQQVLDAAAPLIGESSASLYSQYQAGTVTITDLGPGRGVHRYEVNRSSSFLIVVDLLPG